MSATHICPGRCGRRVRNEYVACRACWHSVPQDLRSQLWNAVKNHNAPVSYGQALEDIVGWLAAHPGPNPLESR